MATESLATTRKAPEDVEPAIISEPVYTVFGVWHKKCILFLAAFAGMFSPMSSFIFYPAIETIAESLEVSVGLINLAITTYMIVSGFAPALLGNAADKLGRRPIYLLALSLYFCANLGLSLQDTYAGLLCLRMIQSAGSSGTISLGYGVIADITTPKERGSYIGVMLLGPNVAPPIGPILGGVLAAKMGWKWIFWMLCILGGACLILIFVALPETSREIVGNGSLAAKGIYKAPISLLSQRRKEKVPCKTPTDISSAEAKKKDRVKFPNPLACLKLLLSKDSAAVLLCNGIYYLVYCSIQGTLSTLFIEAYRYDSLEAGLIYIPFGIACLIGTFVWGKVLDFEFSRFSEKHGVSQDEIRQSGSIGDFPIEKARLRSAMPLVVLSTCTTIAYGWTIHLELHVSGPLILQAVIGFSITGLFVALGTLLTDLNPTRASTASASANLVRCALAAGALAAVDPMLGGIGVGWCFTIFGVLEGLCGPLLFWLQNHGTQERLKQQK